MSPFFGSEVCLSCKFNSPVGLQVGTVAHQRHYFFFLPISRLVTDDPLYCDANPPPPTVAPTTLSQDFAKVIGREAESYYRLPDGTFKLTSVTNSALNA